MKKKICRWIFKNELDEAYTQLNNSYRREMSKIEVVMKQNEKRYGLIKRIFYLFPNAEIIGLDKNKKDEELIIVLNNDTIYLFGERYQGIMGLPRIYFEILTQKRDIFEEKYIHIIDVLMEDNNIGNGTVAMNALIKYAKQIKAKSINGELSSVDNDHADRRNHYYEKFGFIINKSRILLELT
jgi:hypothetical protein